MIEEILLSIALAFHDEIRVPIQHGRDQNVGIFPGIDCFTLFQFLPESRGFLQNPIHDVYEAPF